MNLFEADNKLREDDMAIICGVDEAGRGPLAGPVFAAAVIFKSDVNIPEINDSKKLSAKKREALFDIICEKALTYKICFVDEQEIDNINILNATLKAMTNAVNGLDFTPSIVLIDGNSKPKGLSGDVRTVVSGDAKHACIAAASILAKVSRDRYMEKYAKEYPQYQFEKHKGYGTKLHYQMLAQFGISAIHRRSFLKNLSKHI